MIYILNNDQKLYTQDVEMSEQSRVVPFSPAELEILLPAERIKWRLVDKNVVGDRMWLSVNGYLNHRYSSYYDGSL